MRATYILPLKSASAVADAPLSAQRNMLSSVGVQHNMCIRIVLVEGCQIMLVG